MANPFELGPDRLRTPCDPSIFEFETTRNITDGAVIFGQERAAEAVQFGVQLHGDGYNIFAHGPEGVGRRYLVEHYVSAAARGRPSPPDICYVNNLADANKPRLLMLPAGMAIRLKKDIEELIQEIDTALEGAFETEEYQSRLHAIEEEFRDKPAHGFEELQKKAKARGLTMIQTPLGIAFAPVGDNGEVVSPDDFRKLPDADRERMQKEIQDLQSEVQMVLRQTSRWEREMRAQVKELNREVAAFAVGHLVDEISSGYGDQPEVLAYLAEVRQDITEHARDFQQLGEAQAANPAAALAGGANIWSKRYALNVLVDNGSLEGAPVIYEDNPTYENLLGRIEHVAQMGALVTDYSLIRAGALHRANGGYLILDARKILMAPFAWEGLKRALQSRQIRIEPLGHAMSLVSTVSLEPEHAPLNLKLALIGDRSLYYLLCQHDPDFGGLFKVSADFEEITNRSIANQQAYARLATAIIRKRDLRPFNRAGISRLVEHAARVAGDAERLSLAVGDLSDLLRESDYEAGRNKRDVVTDDDVEKAIEARVFRSSRVRDRMRDEVLRHTIYIATTGAAIGQINGLSVLQLGQYAFGHPVRITARVRPGKGEVVDIEREVELSGPIHSKGVLILAGFLGARYARDFPLALSASLVFEQSYTGVEGDSASSTELYALLSAIAGAPIRQSLAVTGSVNQRGQVQPIGGVNEKIEGFFDVCRERGLTGDQGVLIPASNVKHLMLRKDVIEAARAGQFHVYAVETIDQGIEILTGIPHGTRDESGAYAPDSLGDRIQRSLREMATKQIAFVKASEDRPKL